MLDFRDFKRDKSACAKILVAYHNPRVFMRIVLKTQSVFVGAGHATKAVGQGFDISNLAHPDQAMTSDATR